MDDSNREAATSSDGERSRSYYDALAPRYDDEVTASNADRLIRRAFLELVRTEVPAGSTVLDFGCGTGLDASAMLNAGYRVLAFDNSHAMLARLEQRCNWALANGTLRTASGNLSALDSALLGWPMPDAVISNFAVLNMIGDLAPVFDLFARRLRPRGVVVVSVINPRDWRHVLTTGWWRGNGRRVRGLPPYYLTERFTSYLHSVPSLLRTASGFELMGMGTAGSRARYVSLRPGAVPLFWADATSEASAPGRRSQAGTVSTTKDWLWRSPASRYLGTFAWLALRKRS